MQTWNIGRFLQHALPQELESLRRTGLDRVRSGGMVRWRSHFVPMGRPPCAPHPWEFMTDMYWDLSEDPPVLSFTTVAGIALPASAQPWLERKIRAHNRHAPAALLPLENNSTRISLYASIACEMNAEDLVVFATPRPAGRAVERFVESYETASEILFLTWQEGVEIGRQYREMN